MDKKIFSFNTANIPKLTEVGGKAKALIETTKAGFPVPEGIALSVTFFEEWLKEVKESEEWNLLIKDTSKENCDKVKTMAEKFTLTSKQKAEFEARISQLEGSVFAVRSSSPEEDLEGTSFAGMYETFLGVTRDSLEKFIARAFASCFDFRVMEYKKQNNIDLMGTCIAVIVQRQIVSDVSGVGFSLNPLNNCFDEVFINASFGLGEAIVSGIVTPDSYIFDSVKNKIIKKEINEKKTGLWLKNDGGIEEKQIADPKKTALTDQQIKELAHLIKKCEKHYDKPMDTEWAFEKGKLYLLQSRPITTYIPVLKELMTKAGESKKLYIDYNLMMQGFGEQMSVLGTELWYEMLCVIKGGVGKGGLKGIMPTLHGKCYMDVSNMYLGFGKKNAFSMIKQMAENIGNTIGDLDMNEYTQMPATTEAKQAKRNTVKYGLGMIGPVFKSMVLDYKKSRDSYVKTASDCLSEIEQITKSEKFSMAAKKMPDIFGVVLNEIGATIAGMLAIKSIEKMFRGKNVDDLIINLGMDLEGNPTSEMGHLLFELASHQDFKNTSTEQEFLDNIRNKTYSKDFMVKYETYLKKYGVRVFKEIDVASTRIHEDPSLLYEKLVNINTDSSQLSNVSIRSKHAYDKLFSIAKDGGFEKKFAKKAEVYKNTFGYREHPKYIIVFTFAKLHDKALELGKKLVVEGKLAKAEHIFDLHVSQIEQIEKGLDIDIQKCRETNLEQYKTMKNIKEWPLIFDSRGKIINSKIEAKDGDFVGIKIAPGKVTGRAKILRSPYEKPLDEGEILVAKATEPSWTPIFINAAGVVMEVGGPLQHGGIIAREYGIPCVSGLVGIMDILNDGDLIEVDGTSGIVKLVQEVKHNANK